MSTGHWVIWRRTRVEVNTDPQRRCYWGVHARSEKQWTAWAPLEHSKYLLTPGADSEARLKFWRELNDYSVSVGGSRSEYKVEPELETTP